MSDSARNFHATSSPCLEDATSHKVGGDWALEVEHGPNWLFVKVSGGDVDTTDPPPLAEQLMSLLEQHFTTRIVLEFDSQANMPHGQLIRQLELLDQWVGDHDGVMRLCGLSANCVRAIRRCGLGDQLRACHDREEAVFGGYRPARPR